MAQHYVNSLEDKQLEAALQLSAAMREGICQGMPIKDVDYGALPFLLDKPYLIHFPIVVRALRRNLEGNLTDQRMRMWVISKCLSESYYRLNLKGVATLDKSKERLLELLMIDYKEIN